MSVEIFSNKSNQTLLCFVLRTPSKQKSPQEEKDIDIVELLRNVDPKEYEKYARMYGITDYRGLLQAIEQLKKEKAEESGRPVKLRPVSSSCVRVRSNVLSNNVVVDRNWNVETESQTRTWPDWWPTCRRGWSAQRSGHISSHTEHPLTSAGSQSSAQTT